MVPSTINKFIPMLGKANGLPPLQLRTTQQHMEFQSLLSLENSTMRTASNQKQVHGCTKTFTTKASLELGAGLLMTQP